MSTGRMSSRVYTIGQDLLMCGVQSSRRYVRQRKICVKVILVFQGCTKQAPSQMHNTEPRHAISQRPVGDCRLSIQGAPEAESASAAAARSSSGSAPALLLRTASSSARKPSKRPGTAPAHNISGRACHCSSLQLLEVHRSFVPRTTGDVPAITKSTATAMCLQHPLNLEWYPAVNPAGAHRANSGSQKCVRKPTLCACLDGERGPGSADSQPPPASAGST